MIRDLWRSFSSFVERIGASELFGLKVLGLFASTLFGMILSQLGIAAAVAIFLAVLVYIVIQFIWQYWLQTHSKLETRAAKPKQALIVLVSGGVYDEIPAYGAIKHHFRGEHNNRTEPTLKSLWIVHSRQSDQERDAAPISPQVIEDDQEDVRRPPEKTPQSSYANAMQLQNEFEKNLTHVDRVELKDADNPTEVFSKIQHCYQEAERLGINEADMTIDITGGTKWMSIGAAYSALPTYRSMQFMKPRGYLPDGRANTKLGSDAVEVDVAWVAKHPLFRHLVRSRPV